MSLTPQFKYTKLDGIWTLHNPDALSKFKSGAKDGSYFLSIAPPKKESRSLRQNRYYHGVVVSLLAEHLGYTPVEMHAVFADMFLGSTVEFSGKLISYTKSTTSLSVEDMGGFIQLCVILAAENGCVIPDPDAVKL